MAADTVRLALLARLEAVLAALSGYSVEANRQQAVEAQALEAGPLLVLRDGDFANAPPGNARRGRMFLRWRASPTVEVYLLTRGLSATQKRSAVAGAAAAVLDAVRADAESAAAGSLGALTVEEGLESARIETAYPAGSPDLAGLVVTFDFLYDRSS